MSENKIGFYIPDKQGGNILLYNSELMPDGYTLDQLSELYTKKEPIPYLLSKNVPAPSEMPNTTKLIKNMGLPENILRKAVKKLKLNPAEFPEINS